MTAAEAFMMIARTQFAPFTESDYYGFQGIESENPMLGEFDGWVIVIDDAVAQFEQDGNWFIFNLNLDYEA